jgi:DNA modification methylase
MGTVPDFRLLKGDCLETLKTLESNSIDSCVCDPPYHLQSIQKRFSADDAAPIPESRGALHRLTKGFMGKTWDGGDIAFRTDVWKEVYRVLKPGGYLIAFGGTRTMHRITCAIEDSGFEIRDQLAWCYWSGFPKSHNISKAIDRNLGAEPEVIGVGKMFGKSKDKIYGDYAGEWHITKPASSEAIKWEGWGTALKPAYEPACMARKPIEKGLTVADNVIKWGTGAINIDATRYKYGDPCWPGPQHEMKITTNKGSKFRLAHEQMDNGGFNDPDREHTITPHALGRWPANLYQCSKPNRAEKEAGLQHLQPIAGHKAVHRKEGSAGLNNPRAGAGRTSKEVLNTHPTVKPLGILEFLCKLTTKKGGTILDPFLGSGSTAVAGLINDFNVIGCELTEEYWPIIEGRVQHAREEWHRRNAQYKLF